MSSFKDELVAKVNSVRNTIKTEAIHVFIDKLKTAMKIVAARGRKSGSIALRINLADYLEECDDEDEEDIELCRLDELLLREEVEQGVREERINDGSSMRIYRWLIKEVDKTGIFKDIYLDLNTEKYELDFFWD
jgi:hypothetical protein